MKTYLASYKREFRQIFDALGMKILIFIGPVFLIYFMGGVYYNDYVNDMPVVILDEDNTAISRLISTYFSEDSRFEVVAYADSKLELEDMIADGKAHVGLWIPQGMEEGAKSFKSSEILLIVDGTNLVVANNAYAQATAIIQTMSAGIEMKLLEAKGLTPMTSEQIAKVINIGERMLFDSKMTYMSYLVIPFFAVFLQQLYMSSMGSILIRHQWVLSRGKVLGNVMGMSGAVITAFIPASILCMLTIIHVYDVPIHGSILAAALMAVIFMTALTGPALILASITGDRVKYAQFSLMLSLPTFAASGCVWPVERMPRGLEILIRLLWPLINFAKPVQELLVKGRSLISLIPELTQMVMYGLVYITVGIILYKKAFNRIEGIETKMESSTTSMIQAEV